MVPLERRPKCVPECVSASEPVLLSASVPIAVAAAVVAAVVVVVVVKSVVLVVVVVVANRTLGAVLVDVVRGTGPMCLGGASSTAPSERGVLAPWRSLGVKPPLMRMKLLFSPEGRGETMLMPRANLPEDVTAATGLALPVPGLGELPPEELTADASVDKRRDGDLAPGGETGKEGKGGKSDAEGRSVEPGEGSRGGVPLVVMKVLLWLC
ncbi:hypothetical protein [Hydrogenophaga sp. BPS33]|uniref:hypothetical protein n=1 Tax=Hydrogenophaga sp. BPS33 TaxID=2651974 RepID=UPI00131FF25F|nr:hypothetical protein [Hydrogenophaga sp. BPS33]QHE85853.1 hypothetical protein F9K07_13535 [Hydrogenophaga sp. BPS33]